MLVNLKGYEMKNKGRIKISLKMFLFIALLCAGALFILAKMFSTEGIVIYLHIVITPYPIIFSVGIFVQSLFLKMQKPIRSKKVEFDGKQFIKILSVLILASLITTVVAFNVIMDSGGDHSIGIPPAKIVLPIVGLFLGIIPYLGYLLFLTGNWINDKSRTPLIQTSLVSFVVCASFVALLAVILLFGQE